MKELIKRILRYDTIKNGHYYSPVVDIKQVKGRQKEIWKGVTDDKIPGVDLNVAEQLTLVKELSSFFKTPFSVTKASHRYYFDNPFYSYTDGTILYSFLRHFKPRRVIEVGSGFSSAVMLDTKEHFLPDMDLTFIEPYPKRLLSLMTAEDQSKTKLLQSDVQAIDLAIFEQLQANDILFIDSSHVSKTGSDVNYLIFHILPRLNSGVIIHIHDIFYPFEYPLEWVESGRSWNEGYLFHAFLMYNDRFKIRFFNHFMHLFHKDNFASEPQLYKNAGASLWIQKL